MSRPSGPGGASLASGREILPPEAYAVALLSLPAMWPARLAALLGLGRPHRQGAVLFGGEPETCRRTPAAVWTLVREGRAADVPALVDLLSGDRDVEVVSARWAAAAGRVDVGGLWSRQRRFGLVVAVRGTPGYPPELADDHAAPVVVFRAGARTALDGRRVAIVGTRRCTPAGREIAAELGTALAAAGVRVVSGLALGIDGAAHQGALAAGGSAPDRGGGRRLDRPYPARHHRLWRDVMDTGTLVSEWPLGTQSEGWRFPARNRIIAALAEVVVVVESQRDGRFDDHRGRGTRSRRPGAGRAGQHPQPGSRRAPTGCSGTAATPICGVDDVFDLLALAPPSAPTDRDTRPPPTVGQHGGPRRGRVGPHADGHARHPDRSRPRGAVCPTRAPRARRLGDRRGWVVAAAVTRPVAVSLGVADAAG